MTDPKPPFNPAKMYEGFVRAGFSREMAIAETQRHIDLAQRAATPEPEPPTGKLTAGALGFGEGASFGFADELSGAMSAIPALVPGGESPGEAYTRGRDVHRAAVSGARRDQPLTTLLADVAGSFAVPIGGASKGALTAGKGALRGLLFGGGAGALQGAGRAETMKAVPGDMLAGGLIGGTIGALGGAIHGRAMSKARRNQLINDILEQFQTGPKPGQSKLPPRGGGPPGGSAASVRAQLAAKAAQVVDEAATPVPGLGKPLKDATAKELANLMTQIQAFPENVPANWKQAVQAEIVRRMPRGKS